MLVEFKVSNFRSFRDEAVLSMVPAKDRAGAKMHPHNVYKGNPAAGKAGLLKYAGIIGPNAAGKSNMIAALAVMRTLVLRSQLEEKILRSLIEQYEFDAHIKVKPVFFEITFVSCERKYRYGFTATKDAVMSEWLFFKEKTREQRVYERTEGSETQHFQFGSEYEKDLKPLQSKTRRDALLCSVASSFNFLHACNVIQFFRDNVRIISGDDDNIFLYGPETSTEYLWKANALSKGTILDFLRAADIDIYNIELKQQSLEEYVRDKLIFRRNESLNDEAKRIGARIKPYHKGVDEHGKETLVEFEFSWESRGTKLLFVLLGPIYDVLTNGRCLVVDEIDTSFHTHLTAMIIECFRSEKLNKKGAQLIFTTHDLELLDMDLLRRDQINIVQKVNGASSIYSLWDVDGVDPQRHNIRDRYFVGKYGGIPVIELPDESVLTGDTEEEK